MYTRPQEERREGAVQMYVPVGPKLGNIVVEMEGVTKGFEGRLLYEDLSLSLPRCVCVFVCVCVCVY